MKSLRKPWRLQMRINSLLLPVRSYKTRESAERRSDEIRHNYILPSKDDPFKHETYPDKWQVMIWKEVAHG